MTRSVFEYYRDFWIGSPGASEEELPGELVFGEEASLEQSDSGTDRDVFLALSDLVCFRDPSWRSLIVNADKSLY
jgi:hypothetical protein